MCARYWTRVSFIATADYYCRHLLTDFWLKRSIDSTVVSSHACPGLFTSSPDIDDQTKVRQFAG